MVSRMVSLQQKPTQCKASGTLEVYLPFARALPSQCPQHRRTHTTVQWRTSDTLVLDHPEIELFPDNAVTTKELIASECAMCCARQFTRNRLLLSMHRFSSMFQRAHHEGQYSLPQQTRTSTSQELWARNQFWERVRKKRRRHTRSDAA